MEGVRGICEQMNSDIFDGVDRTSYSLEGFSRTEIEQAKHEFRWCGYAVYEEEQKLKVRK
jgi:hypothetical protein